MKVKEITYMVLDLCKDASDDSYLTEEHVIFLLKKYRSFLIKKEQEKEKASTDVASEFEYQQICLDLEKVEAIEGMPCTGGYYLRSTKPVPDLMPFGTTRLYPSGSYYKGNIEFVTKDRFKYVGNNKWTQNIIYATLDPSDRIYLTSANPQFLYLQQATLTGIFENPEDVADLECSNASDAACDILDKDFPLEDALVAPLVELVAKELSPSVPAPEDKENNADDNLSQKA